MDDAQGILQEVTTVSDYGYIGPDKFQEQKFNKSVDPRFRVILYQ